MNGNSTSGLGRADPVGTRLGILMAGRIAWRPSRRLGLGMYGFANLNDARSFAGLAAVLELGRLR